MYIYIYIDLIYGMYGNTYLIYGIYGNTYLIYGNINSYIYIRYIKIYLRKKKPGLKSFSKMKFQFVPHFDWTVWRVVTLEFQIHNSQVLLNICYLEM